MIFREISSTTVVLGDKSINCNNKMALGKESAESTSNAIRELATSVDVTASTVTNISKSINVSSDHIGQVYEITKNIDTYFKDTMSDVNSNEVAVAGMAEQMNAIKQAAESSYETIFQEISAIAGIQVNITTEVADEMTGLATISDKLSELIRA